MKFQEKEFSTTTITTTTTATATTTATTTTTTTTKNLDKKQACQIFRLQTSCHEGMGQLIYSSTYF